MQVCKIGSQPGHERHAVSLRRCGNGMQVCKINGKSYMAGLPQKVGLESKNSVTVPERHVGVPAEEGAFEFVPNPYTRKQ